MDRWHNTFTRLKTECASCAGRTTGSNRSTKCFVCDESLKDDRELIMTERGWSGPARAITPAMMSSSVKSSFCANTDLVSVAFQARRKPRTRQESGTSLHIVQLFIDQLIINQSDN